MTPQTELEIKGNFFANPFADLAAEIRQARLTGSLRASDKDKKWVVYFKDGQIVFGVSNSREARLFDIMLKRNRLSKDDLVKVPNFANDFELTAYLQENGLLNRSDSDNLFVEQIEGIIVDSLSWNNGDWTFSSLMRIRDGLSFSIEIQKLLINYARGLSDEKVLNRFRSLDEVFSLSGTTSKLPDLSPEEAFILSHVSGEPQTAAQIVLRARIPDVKTLHALYTLWMAGSIDRGSWQTVFSDMRIEAMLGARIELKREAKSPAVTIAAPKEDPAAAKPDEPEFTMTVEQYLDQVENAPTFYDLLGVEPAADIDELKRAYFRLARNFHPDRYHAEGGELLRRMQNAFTELAQAHETLKNRETRETYDYRIRKELAAREKVATVGGDEREIIDKERASENFEAGFSLLMDGEAEASIPFLARAAHFAPQNPRHRAYYGKALATDESQRHKAESEIQAAIRLDPDNLNFKLMLAEFFIQFNLLKRAEGELTRLLAVYPSNREARKMLENLQNK